MAGLSPFLPGPGTIRAFSPYRSYHSCSTPRAYTLSCGPYLAPWLPRPGCSYVGRAQSGFLTVNSALGEAGKHSHIGRMLRKVPFIKPMSPTLAKEIPPAGPDWMHEVKFDGWRAQVHIEDGAATLYSKNGADITRRFSSLRPALARVPAKSAVVDCELIACDETGMPSFRSLMNLGNEAPALCSGASTSCRWTA